PAPAAAPARAGARRTRARRSASPAARSPPARTCASSRACAGTRARWRNPTPCLGLLVLPVVGEVVVAGVSDRKLCPHLLAHLAQDIIPSLIGLPGSDRPRQLALFRAVGCGRAVGDPLAHEHRAGVGGHERHLALVAWRRRAKGLVVPAGPRR